MLSYTKAKTIYAIYFRTFPGLHPENVNVKEVEVEGSEGGGDGKTGHIAPRRTRHILCACDRLLALSSPPSPPEARQHLQVRRARLYGGSETDVPSALLLLTYTKTHTLSCTHTHMHTHMLAAIQNRHQDPAGVTGQRDPELDPSLQHLRQERDTIGFSCDSQRSLSPACLLLIKTNCFLKAKQLSLLLKPTPWSMERGGEVRGERWREGKRIRPK